MRKVGYAENTTIVPRNLTNSKGFKQLCEEAGLTDELLNMSLVEDIKKKKYNRVRELELGYKVRGRIKGDNETKNTQINIFTDEQGRRIASRILNLSAGTEEPHRLHDSGEPEVRTDVASGGDSA